MAILTAEHRIRVLSRMIALFTRTALPSVMVILLTGLYSSFVHVGSLHALFGTAYGNTLLFKLFVVIIMLLLGAVNGFRFGPRAARMASTGGEEDRTGVERGFLRSARAEALLGVLVLLIAALLAFTTPGSTI